MRTREELMALGLTKWPQCIITGDRISQEEALEIIRRTDDVFVFPFYTLHNDDGYMDYIIKTLHIPTGYSNSMEDTERHLEDVKKWTKKWGSVELNYLNNSYVCSNYIYGADGWCHPDGSIGYIRNIGKWPSVEEVYTDFKIIASTWRFLNLECTIMDGEYADEDNSPVVSFVVRNGDVEIVDPEEVDVHKEYGRTIQPKVSEEEEAEMFRKVIKNGYHSMIPKDVIASWAKYSE